MKALKINVKVGQERRREVQVFSNFPTQAYTAVAAAAAAVRKV